jgi:hypothetical protein
MDGVVVVPSDLATGADPETMGDTRGFVVPGAVTGAMVTGGRAIGDGITGAMVRSFRQKSGFTLVRSQIPLRIQSE